jgi:Fe-S cluster biosynthesis and repair protein YggX
MSKMLKELGAPVPELAAKAPERPPGEGEIHCHRCNQVKRKLAKPPFKNAFGQEIYEKICADCWREAIGYGTKVINELRLPMADPQAQKMWDQHVKEFLTLN